MKSDGSTSERVSTEFNADAPLLLQTSGKSQPELRRQQGISGASFGALKRGKIRNGCHPNCTYEGTHSEFSVLQKENLRLKPGKQNPPPTERDFKKIHQHIFIRPAAETCVVIMNLTCIHYESPTAKRMVTLH
jgi:hypothetical protein